MYELKHSVSMTIKSSFQARRRMAGELRKKEKCLCGPISLESLRMKIGNVQRVPSCGLDVVVRNSTVLAIDPLQCHPALYSRKPFYPFAAFREVRIQLREESGPLLVIGGMG